MRWAWRLIRLGLFGVALVLYGIWAALAVLLVLILVASLPLMLVSEPEDEEA